MIVKPTDAAILSRVQFETASTVRTRTRSGAAPCATERRYGPAPTQIRSQLKSERKILHFCVRVSLASTVIK